jgi:glycosyltransferase 2 family protein
MPFGALGVTEQVSKTLFQNLVGFATGDLAMLGYRAIMYAAGLISVVVYLANLNQVRTLREKPASVT